MNLLLVVVIAIFIGALVQASTGFGFSITTMMVLPLFLTVLDSMVLINMTNFIAITYVMVKYRQHIQWPLVGVPLILSLVGNYIGLTKLESMNNTMAQQLLGVALFSLAIYLFFFSSRIKVPANQWTAALSGTTSGLMSGFFGIPGPPMVLYYSVATHCKETYIGTIQFFFLINAIFRSMFFLTSANVNQQVWSILPYGIFAAIAGALVGQWVFQKASTAIVHKLIYGWMAIAGIYYIV